MLSDDDELEALRMLADRRDELPRGGVQTVNRLQRLLSEPTPGRAKKDRTALRAKGGPASVRPQDLAGKTRKRLAVEQLTELVAVDKRTKVLAWTPQKRVPSSALRRPARAAARAEYQASATSIAIPFRTGIAWRA